MRNYAHDPRTWIERFWQDEWFQQAVERRWLELMEKDIATTLTAYMDETSTLLQASQQLNFQKWKILNTRVYLEQFLFPTYKGGVDYLKTYLQNRIAFLTENFVHPEPEKPSEPFAAENFYYWIMNKRSNNVIDVTDESLIPGASLMLWEPKDEDDSQLWKIEPAGNDVFQFINKQSELAMTANGKANNLKQTPPDISDRTQQWQIIPVLTGNIYGIVNVASGYSANNSGGGLDNGTPVIEYDNNIYSEEKLNQHWYIRKVEMIENGGQGTKLEINRTQTTKSNRIQSVRIYDIAGRIRYSGKTSAGETSVDLSGWTPGIYIVKTEDAVVRIIKK
jgi:hypothetical protein